MTKTIKQTHTVFISFLFVISVGLGYMALSTSYAFAGKKDLNLEHQEFYKYANYLFTKDERKIFMNLPDDKSRDEFIRNFWEIRDPNPLTEENEFKVEIEQRFEYAAKYLKEGPIPGWKTDRGRIYILLGAPTNVLEQSIDTSFGREIYWYFAESNIFIRFEDTNSTGVFRMDLRNVSLKLLDELEKRKYYIINKDEKENFITALLDFDIKYDKEQKNLVIVLDAKNISYEKEQDSNLMIAKIKVSFIIYAANNKFSEHNDIKTLKLTEDELLANKSKLTLLIPVELPKGKVKIDAIITDFLGDAVQRKFINIKN